MKRSIKYIQNIMVIALFIAACNFNPSPQGGSTPTIQAVASFTPEISPTASLTPTPPNLEVESTLPSSPPPEPTQTPTASDTPGPYEHTVQTGDSLISIIQEYGYTDFSTSSGSIISGIVELNDNIPNADVLPGPGSVILIPRQTATPTAASTEAALSIEATNAASVPNVQFSESTTITQYIVQEGDTIISIASENNLTLEQLAVLNPDLNFFSCNFEIPSGGEGCNVPLQISQSINLPAPTPTPTLSPIPSGSETPTSTPTHIAPMLIYPPQGSIAQPFVFNLQWVGVGILQPDEVYLIQITDLTDPNIPPFHDITKNTSYELPEFLIPSDGQTHTFSWVVSVAKPNDEGAYVGISGQPEIHSFQWQSR